MEMKFMGIDDKNSNSNTNWLGFSLSPHMNMEVHQTPSAVSAAASVSVPIAVATASFFNSSSHLDYGGFYGVEGENNGLYSSLPVMPLKSDGSLCIMEALGRSRQPQAATTMVTGSTPKLEDFFGGATMGTHHYGGSNDREAMVLSLDCMDYHQHDQAKHEPNNNNSQNFPNHLQQNTSRNNHHQQIHVQQYPYYSNVRSHEMMVAAKEAKENQVSDCNIQLPTMGGGDDGVSSTKNWVSRNFPGNQAMEQKMISCIGDNGSTMAYGDFQSLSLSMSPGSHSSCITGSQQISPAVTESTVMETKKRGPDKADQKQIIHRKSIDTFGQRTSQYRGVTRHRWTGRYEAHLWDNSCKKEGQSRKGRQVYLGGYDMEEKAARAYDLAALKYWGPSTHINFPLVNYQKELEEMKNMTRQEYVACLRRKSSGFSRGASIYRGVTRHHQHGRWQARIGRVAGNKDLYLGTFSTQEEAGEAYDIAAIKFRGVNAVTNFDITRYDVEKIMASNTLLAGELARRNKNVGSGIEAIGHTPSTHDNDVKAILPLKSGESTESAWRMVLYQSGQQLDHKPPNIMDSFKNVIGTGNMSSVQQHEGEESVGKMGTQHLSNASSLVTSLSSSREGSPAGSASMPMLVATPTSAAAASNFLITSPTNNASSWIPSAAAAQLRPATAVSLPQMPVFAAWTDA